MLSLILCILFTASLGLFFKWFEKFGINNFQAIVFNYVSCVLTGCIVQQSFPDYLAYSSAGWFPFAITLGCSFLFFFNVMGRIVMQSGVTVMSVANKLSLVIPVVVAFILYHESVTALKLAGIFLALISVIFVSLKKEVKHNSSQKNINASMLALPLLLFFGSGANDSLVKYAQINFMSDTDNAPFNIKIFSASASAGIAILLSQIIFFGKKISWKSAAGGIILGIPNYFTMHFLVKALANSGLESSVVFPINNIGIVAASALFAYLLFREKLSLLNLIGLGLAFAAIVLIAV